MNVPNAITLARIALIPVFLLSLPRIGLGEDYYGWAPFVIFAIASLTDGIDGFIARKYNKVSTFGKFIDPLADKLLVASALIVFVERGHMTAWIAIVVLAREFIVTSLRLVAVDRGIVVAAKLSGKIKTTVQIFGVLLILSPWHTRELTHTFTVGDAACWVILLVTVWSGVDYFVKHGELFKSA